MTAGGSPASLWYKVRSGGLACAQVTIGHCMWGRTISSSRTCQFGSWRSPTWINNSGGKARGHLPVCDVLAIEQHGASSMRESPGSSSEAQALDGHLRVFAISDLHTDYKENMEWVRNLPRRCRSGRVLVVAGDISDSLDNIRATLEELLVRFEHVFYTPGNHELWVKGDTSKHGGAKDSLQKLYLVLSLCVQLGVHIVPHRLGNLWIAPLLSWHHKTFDKEQDIPGVPSYMSVNDYIACEWPTQICRGSSMGSEETAKWFDQVNDDWSMLDRGSMGTTMENRQVLPSSKEVSRIWRHVMEREEGCDLITFSHFLPDQRLLPEKRYLMFPNLAKVVGSDFLGARLQKLKPQVHIFGHTHFGWDMVVGGIRYIQPPVGYPVERRKRLRSLKLEGSWQEPHDLAPSDRPPPSSLLAEVAPVLPDWLPVPIYVADYTLKKGSTDECSEGCEGHCGLARSARNGDDHFLVSSQCQGHATISRAKSAAVSGQVSADMSDPTITGLPDSTDDENEDGQTWESSEGLSQGMGVLKDSAHGQSCNEGPDANHSRLRHVGAPGPPPTPRDKASGGTAGSGRAHRGAGCYVLQHWNARYCEPMSCSWSDHYQTTPRQPSNVELAPWVAARYTRRQSNKET